MEEWTIRRPVLLDELHRHDGFIPPSGNLCASCSNTMSDRSLYYRCIDCSIRTKQCNECLVKEHSNEPFHRIEVG